MTTTPDNSAITVIFGFREESRPKGHGYLYWRREDKRQEERMLCHCDLYDVRDETVLQIFEKALREVLCELGVDRRGVSGVSIKTENMSALAQALLQKSLERLSRGFHEAL